MERIEYECHQMEAEKIALSNRISQYKGMVDSINQIGESTQYTDNSIDMDWNSELIRTRNTLEIEKKKLEDAQIITNEVLHILHIVKTAVRYHI